MSYNDNLNKVKSEPNDELYTFYNTIEKEMNHYRQDKFFKNKIIYLNCDDANFSQFWWYFYSQYDKLNYKELHATCYHENNNGEHWSFIPEEKMYSKEKLRSELRRRVNSTTNIIKCEMFDAVNHEILNGNGSFDSDECINILKRSDVVVTNPPFSLFKDFVPLIVKNNKYLITIGPLNGLAYKNIFPLIKNNLLWKGYEVSAKEFITPKDTVQKFGNITWYTNVPTRKRMDYYKTYDLYLPDESNMKHIKYDNYDAIEGVWRKDINSKPTKTIIPCNYKGIIGVPISFIDSFNPNQFEIIGITEASGKGMSGEANWIKGSNPKATINNKAVYTRLFIRWNPEAMPTMIDGKIPEYNY